MQRCGALCKKVLNHSRCQRGDIRFLVYFQTDIVQNSTKNNSISVTSLVGSNGTVQGVRTLPVCLCACVCSHSVTNTTQSIRADIFHCLPSSAVIFCAGSSKNVFAVATTNVNTRVGHRHQHFSSLHPVPRSYGHVLLPRQESQR